MIIEALLPEQLRDNLKIGDVVSFYWKEYSKNRPQTARIYRIRHDMIWEDALHVPQLKATNSILLSLFSFLSFPHFPCP
jgi:hypothetical protein